MAASFKIYKIEEVYVLVSNLGSQCFLNDVLIFNTDGETLKMLANVDIEFNGKEIKIEQTKGSCMDDGTKYSFEVSGLEIKEK